jgi:hypothetical protein
MTVALVGRTRDRFTALEKRQTAIANRQGVLLRLLRENRQRIQVVAQALADVRSRTDRLEVAGLARQIEEIKEDLRDVGLVAHACLTGSRRNGKQHSRVNGTVEE